MSNNLSINIEFECDHFDGECKHDRRCPLIDHCNEGFVNLEDCEFELEYEPPDPGGWECAPSGASLDIISGTHNDVDILTGLPDDIAEMIHNQLFNAWEGYLDDMEADYQISRYEDQMNDDICPQYFDGT